MPKPAPTLYDVLGVKPDVKHHELVFLYDRRITALRREEAVPDPKAEAALRAAFDVLGDPDRREAYDRELAQARPRLAYGRVRVVAAAAFVLLVAAGIAWYLARPPASPTGIAASALEAIAAQATIAIGRVQSIDISGNTRSAGLAVAIGEEVMVASCEHLSPSEQIAVRLGARTVPARISSIDEALGICRLEVPGAGSWPLQVAGTGARAGDVVYATEMNAVGEARLREARVTSVVDSQGAQVVATTIATATPGAPILDGHGRVVAVASSGRQVAIPPAWARER